MTLSKIYLGAPIEQQRAHERAIRAELGKVHAAAQRVAWGILMGERLGIELEREAARVQAEHGEQVGGQMALALLRAHQGRHDQARTHLQRARELAGSDHPYGWLVPSDAKWEERL